MVSSDIVAGGLLGDESLTKIVVRDNGHGFTKEEADRAFASPGGSTMRESPYQMAVSNKVQTHGSQGRAGTSSTWTSSLASWNEACQLLPVDVFSATSLGVPPKRPDRRVDAVVSSRSVRTRWWVRQVLDGATDGRGRGEARTESMAHPWRRRSMPPLFALVRSVRRTPGSRAVLPADVRQRPSRVHC